MSNNTVTCPCCSEFAPIEWNGEYPCVSDHDAAPGYRCQWSREAPATRDLARLYAATGAALNGLRALR